MSSESEFLDGWIEAVTIAGPSLFGNGADPYLAQSKWDLEPNLSAIRSRITTMSNGEAVFVAALTCFYSEEDGLELLQQANHQSPTGLRSLANSLDSERRSVIALLFATFPGW
jgi:hypothetical protein